MANSGSHDITQNLEDFASALAGAAEDLDGLYEHVCKGLAARLLAEVIPDTPVEQNGTISYKGPYGKILTRNTRGGALRRGWVHDPKPGKSPGAAEQLAYVNSLPVRSTGSSHSITVSNNVEYATYVENGHIQHVGQFVPWLGPEVDGVRQGATLKKAFVPGQYMLRNATRRIESRMPGLCEKLGQEWFDKKFRKAGK